jgi:serine phosphatase RsbU (regulator of sigma subunit)
MPLAGSTLDADDVTRRITELQRVIEAQQTRAHQHLQLAAKVHRSLLPLPVRTDRIEVDVRYLPVDEVGGDYCQVRFPSENICYITICDVTGHGIGADRSHPRADHRVSARTSDR